MKSIRTNLLQTTIFDKELASSKSTGCSETVLPCLLDFYRTKFPLIAPQKESKFKKSLQSNSDSKGGANSDNNPGRSSDSNGDANSDETPATGSPDSNSDLKVKELENPNPASDSKLGPNPVPQIVDKNVGTGKKQSADPELESENSLDESLWNEIDNDEHKSSFGSKDHENTQKQNRKTPQKSDSAGASSSTSELESSKSKNDEDEQKDNHEEVLQ